MLAPLHWHSKFPQFFCIHLGYAQCNIESPWNPYKYCTMKISEEDMRANTMYRASHPFRWRSFAGAEGCQHWGPILCGTLLASGFSGKTPVGHHGLMAAFGIEVCHPSLASNTVRLLWLNWASCTEAVLMPKLSVTLRKQLVVRTHRINRTLPWGGRLGGQSLLAPAVWRFGFEHGTSCLALSKQLGQEVAWEGEADGLKKAVAHGFQEQRHAVGCTCFHVRDIVTKTNLQDYGPRCFFWLKSWTCGCFLQRWYVFIHIYSLIMKKVGESLTTKFARYFCWQKLGHWVANCWPYKVLSFLLTLRRSLAAWAIGAIG